MFIDAFPFKRRSQTRVQSQCVHKQEAQKKAHAYNAICIAANIKIGFCITQFQVILIIEVGVQNVGVILNRKCRKLRPEEHVQRHRCDGGEAPDRRKIKLIENNAKCRHKKKIVFICLRPRTPYPPPPLHTAYVYTAYLFTRKGEGGELNRREGQRGNSSQSWVENNNMTDCISSL